MTCFIGDYEVLEALSNCKRLFEKEIALLEVWEYFDFWLCLVAVCCGVFTVWLWVFVSGQRCVTIC